jgi:hypothetical protein
MPGEARQGGGVLHRDFHQRLGLGDHDNGRAAVEHKSVAVVQRRRLRQVQQ